MIFYKIFLYCTYFRKDINYKNEKATLVKLIRFAIVDIVFFNEEKSAQCRRCIVAYMQVDLTMNICFGTHVR